MLRIQSPTVEEVTGSREWRVEDTGGGLHPSKLISTGVKTIRWVPLAACVRALQEPEWIYAST